VKIVKMTHTVAGKQPVRAVITTKTKVSCLLAIITNMRIIAALLIILFYSPTGSAKTGNRVRGSSRAPGLEKAEDNYKTAKQLYYEALQLLDEAEKAEEEAQEGELAQIEAEIEGLGNEIDATISSGPTMPETATLSVQE
jgi:hypothetical protein